MENAHFSCPNGVSNNSPAAGHTVLRRVLIQDYMDYGTYRNHRLRDIQGIRSYKYLVR